MFLHVFLHVFLQMFLQSRKKLAKNRGLFVMSKKLEVKKIQKVGNSVGVVLSRSDLDFLELEKDSEVMIQTIKKGKVKSLVISPACSESIKEEKAKTIKRAKKVISEVERVASVLPVEVPAVTKNTSQNNIVFKKEELQTISSIQNYAAANDFECFTRRVNIPTEKLAHAFTFDELTLIKNILFQVASDTYLETLEEQGLMTQTLVRLADKAKLLVQKYWSDEI